MKIDTSGMARVAPDMIDPRYLVVEERDGEVYITSWCGPTVPRRNIKNGAVVIDMQRLRRITAEEIV